MNGKEALFKSKAELKAEKEAAKAKKKLEKSKVMATLCCCCWVQPCWPWHAQYVALQP